jgi:hypothetical protein
MATKDDLSLVIQTTKDEIKMLTQTTKDDLKMVIEKKWLQKFFHRELIFPNFPSEQGIPPQKFRII